MAVPGGEGDLRRHSPILAGSKRIRPAWGCLMGRGPALGGVSEEDSEFQGLTLADGS